ncbi:MAG: phosphoheptose isomerase, partial [Eubacteriales bacterium]|nr:phosphoheptose isomerase [Eubacteriales bacterium]
MSFMFHPYPYADPEAVNTVTGQNFHSTAGVHAVAKEITALLKSGQKVGLDAYPGADVASLINVVRQQCAGAPVTLVDAASLLKSGREITELLAPYLPNDREEDPVLLYGRRYLQGYQGLQQQEKVDALRRRLAAAGGVL